MHCIKLYCMLRCRWGSGTWSWPRVTATILLLLLLTLSIACCVAGGVVARGAGHMLLQLFFSSSLHSSLEL